jgi:hypothetical protein
MLDIHKDLKIFLERPEFIVPQRKGTKGNFPTIARPDKKSFRVDVYYKGLKHDDWEAIKVRNTKKGYLKASYHFAQVFIMNETRGTIERRLLVICRTKTKKGFEIKCLLRPVLLCCKKLMANIRKQEFRYTMFSLVWEWQSSLHDKKDFCNSWKKYKTQAKRQPA